MSTETIEATTYSGSETEIVFDAIDGLFEPNQAITINTGGDKATVVKVRNIVTRYKKKTGTKLKTVVKDDKIFIVYLKQD